MKRTLFLSVIALILSLLTAAGASAVTVDLTDTSKTVVDYGDWIIEKIHEDTEWELDRYKGTTTEVITPRIIDDMLVVAFGSRCFANNTEIKSVITSSPLWTVGEYAFIDCTSLESFECNYALKTIAVGAFSGTSSLKSINLEDSVVEAISTFAFSDSGLEDVTLPDTCKRIDNYAFLRCGSLRKITIPAGVADIAENAFEDCDNLVIYCCTDSYAHQYAEEKGIKYVLIDAPQPITFILGDSDGDGEITILDATKLQRILADLDTDEDGMITLRGDIDGDGLNVMDATKIQRHIADYSIAEPVGEEVTREVTTE